MIHAEMYEMHGLLHRLWSKTGTTAYNKEEWKRLEQLMGKAFRKMLGPAADRVGYLNLIRPKEGSSS